MRAWIFSILCMLGLAAAPAWAQPAGRIMAVKFGGDAERTRIVISSDKPLTYHVFSLDSGVKRLVVDLPRVRWSVGGLTAESGTGQGKGLVTAWRYSHNTASSSRLILDLAGPAVVSRDFVLAPAADDATYRIILDVEKATAAQFTAAVARGTGPAREAAPRAARKPLIVIDPGHGGKDPGASSPTGVREKDVTLAIAQALRDELLATRRYDVALTRADDTFIELDQRVAKARALGADLFISLHADAGPNPATRGASVYTLSPEGERRAESERHRNDWVMAVETDTTRSQEVNAILADLVQRETRNQSSRFAQTLAPAISEAGWPVLTNAHRRRGFYVLLSPDVPAVLFEMGFITNHEDEAMLTSAARRRRLVQGISRAIDGFFDSEARLLAQR